MALLAPVLLIGCLGFADGGFGLEARHLAGIVAWLVVIALLATGRAGRISVMRPVLVSAGLILAVAALSLVSSLWSGSVERSFGEAGRVLVYLSFLLVALLLTQTGTLRKRFAEGIAVSIAVIVLVGLASRLLPDLITVTGPSTEGPRLRFPLGYWNAIGAFAGIGMVLLLWVQAQARPKAARWLAAALIPAFILALYFTYSRGGALAAVVASFMLLALSADRLRHLVVLVLAAIAVAPGLIAVQSRRELADGMQGAAQTAQGLEVLGLLLAGTAAMIAALLALRKFRDTHPAWTERSIAFSRRPVTLKAIGAVIAVAGVVAAVAFGGQAWDEFSDPALQFPERPEEHFGNLSGAGRHEFWRVAVESYGENPVLGTGAGTYEFTWRQLREIDPPVRDAHSLYLEAFAELGTFGGLLVLAMILGLLGLGATAWRAARGASRELASALLAAMVTFSVIAAFDWFWELAAVGAIFFLAAGVLVSGRCDQLRPGDGEAASNGNGTRYTAAITGLATGWAAIAILAGPLIMHFELNRSQSAAAAGNIAPAVDHALTARSLQPWAASPYIQLGGLAELEGSYEVALEHYDEASKRESDNWQIWFLMSRAARASGESTEADRYLDRARELNPRAPELQASE